MVGGVKSRKQPCEYCTSPGHRAVHVGCVNTDKKQGRGRVLDEYWTYRPVTSAPTLYFNQYSHIRLRGPVQGESAGCVSFLSVGALGCELTGMCE